MKSAVTKYEEKHFLEFYPKNDEDNDFILDLTEEQYQLVNQILIETNAKFIQIGDITFNTSAIRRVYKKPIKSIGGGVPQVEILSEEQRRKNLEALEKLKSQLRVKGIINQKAS